MYRLPVIAAFFVLITLILSPSCAPPDNGLKLIVADNFSDPGSGWDVYSYTSGDKAAYDNGEYSVLINGAKRIVWSTNSNYFYDMGDFACEVDARNMAKDADDSDFGIAFRCKNTNNTYIVQVMSAKGSYRFLKFIDGKLTTLKDWSPADHINSGSAVNKLKAVCIGQTIDFYINGNKLDSFTDSSLEGGYVGLEVGTWDVPRAEYRFDNFMLYAATPAATSTTSNVPLAPASPVVGDSAVLKSRNLKLLLADDFSSPKSGWMFAKSNSGEAIYQLSEMSIWNKDSSKAVISWNPNYKMPLDFMADISVRRVSGDDNSSFAIVFRENESKDKYTFIVISDGEYGLAKRVQGKTVYLIHQTKSGYIKAGNLTNKFRVACVGPQIELYANGNKLDAITDDAPLSGTANIEFAVTTGLPVEARYNLDDFRIYAVE